MASSGSHDAVKADGMITTALPPVDDCAHACSCLVVGFELQLMFRPDFFRLSWIFARRVGPMQLELKTLSRALLAAVVTSPTLKPDGSLLQFPEMQTPRHDESMLIVTP